MLYHIYGLLRFWMYPKKERYLAILLCPFIIDFFQSMLHVKSQQFAFIFNLCIALVATIWAYVKRDSFLFNDKI